MSFDWLRKIIYEITTGQSLLQNFQVVHALYKKNIYSPIEIFKAWYHFEDFLSVIFYRSSFIIEEIKIFEMLEILQGLKGSKIFDSITAQIKMRQLWTCFQ